MSAALNAAETPNAAGVLELTLWGEAADRPVRAIEGLAALVMNRARLAARPDGPRHLGEDIATICRAPFQFACWNRNHPRHTALGDAALLDHAGFAICRRIAARALSGTLADPTRGATHYHPVDALPRWAIGQVPTAELGGLVFYRMLG